MSTTEDVLRLDEPDSFAVTRDRVADILSEAAQIRRDRANQYGDAAAMSAGATSFLFPKGVALISQKDHRRFFLLRMVTAKLARYAVAFATGGHSDSLKDAIVYLAMLQDLDTGGHVDDLPF